MNAHILHFPATEEPVFSPEERAEIDQAKDDVIEVLCLVEAKAPECYLTKPASLLGIYEYLGRKGSIPMFGYAAGELYREGKVSLKAPNNMLLVELTDYPGGMGDETDFSEIPHERGGKSDGLHVTQVSADESDRHSANAELDGTQKRNGCVLQTDMPQTAERRAEASSVSASQPRNQPVLTDSCGGTCAGRHGIGAISRDSLTAHTGAETQAAQSAGTNSLVLHLARKEAARTIEQRIRERNKS